MILDDFKNCDMKTKRSGFSLIELLVVVAIIGILAAIGTIGYNKYIKYTQDTVMDANRHEFVESLKVQISASSNQTTYKSCFELIDHEITLRNQTARNVYTQNQGSAVWINGHAEANIDALGFVNFLQGEQLVACQNPNAPINASDIVICSCKDSFCSTDTAQFNLDPKNACPNPQYY
jgi:prepilin-type N-terminal cleavage/methylation domain-containing protein